MNHSKYPWLFRTLLILLTGALLVSVTYNSLAYRKSDEHALDHYAHQNYSTTLQHYETSIMVSLKECVRDIQLAMESKTVNYDTLEQWELAYRKLNDDQNVYSGLMQHYALNGRKLLEPLVTNPDVFSLNAVPGFTYYQPVSAYFSLKLSQLRGREDVWKLTDTDRKKLETIHELSAAQLSIYERYMTETFDPMQLEKAIVLRLKLQRDLFQAMPGAVEQTIGIQQ